MAPKFNSYAQKVADEFYKAHLHAETDVSEHLLNKKIRNAELAQWNFIFGESEAGIMVGIIFR